MGGLSWRWGMTGRRDSSGDLGMTGGRGRRFELAMGHDRKARFLGGPRNDRGGSQYSLSGSSNQFEDRSFQVGLAE